MTPTAVPYADPPAHDCVIVVPYAQVEGYSEQHWNDVSEIIASGVRAAGRTSTNARDAESTGRLTQSSLDVISSARCAIFDLSTISPNSMFEVGFRISTGFPLLIVTDGQKPLLFDVAHFSYIIYPKSLQYRETQEFIDVLAKKLRDQNYTEVVTTGEKRMVRLDRSTPEYVEIAAAYEQAIQAAERDNELEDREGVLRGLRFGQALFARAELKVVEFKVGIWMTVDYACEKAVEGYASTALGALGALILSFARKTLHINLSI